MAKKRRRKDALSSLTDTSLGLGKLGVTTGVSAAAAAQAAAGTHAAPITGGFVQIAQAAPIATTVSIGGGLLGSLRQLNKKQAYKFPKKKRR